MQKIKISERCLERRPLKSRSLGAAKSLAATLAKLKVSPNHISLLSVLFSIIAMALYYLAFRVHFFYFAFVILAIQLRLLCNLFDGMVAIEHGQKTITGELYNDVPDRFSDFFIIFGAGLASASMPYSIMLALIAASAAITTAYVRVLGAALGCKQHFSGPMAKPHRMALLSASALTDLIFLSSGTFLEAYATYFALILIIVGSLITIINRLSKITAELKQSVAHDN